MKIILAIRDFLFRDITRTHSFIFLLFCLIGMIYLANPPQEVSDQGGIDVQEDDNASEGGAKFRIIDAAGWAIIYTFNFTFFQSEPSAVKVVHVVTATTCFWVIAYFFITWAIVNYRDSQEELDASEFRKWANSVYYLGFILTLSSIISALGSFDFNPPSGDGGIAGAASDIIIKNAIALTSTVVGLIVRTIWLLALKSEETRLRLLEDEFEARIKKLIETTQDLSDAIHRQAEGAVQEIRRVADASIAAIEAQSNASVDRLTAGIDTVTAALEPVSSKVDAFAKSLGENRLDEIIAAFNRDLTRLQTSVDQLSTSIDGRRESLEDLTNILRDSVSSINTHLSSIARLGDLSTNLSGFGNELGSTQSALRDASSSLTDAANGLNGVVDEVSGAFAQAIEKINEASNSQPQ